MSDFYKAPENELARVKTVMAVGKAFAFAHKDGKEILRGWAVITRTSEKNNFFIATCHCPADKVYPVLTDIAFDHHGRYKSSINWSWERCDLDLNKPVDPKTGQPLQEPEVEEFGVESAAETEEFNG